MRTAFHFATLIATLASGAAAAAERYAATIDVNLRSGPGANYPIVEILRSGDTITATACESGWCMVPTPGGGQAFVAARFLSREHATPVPAGSDISPATPAVLDTTTTASVPPVVSAASPSLPDTALKYVATHRPLSVDLGYEAQVGAAIPADIRLRDIPGSRYQYVYIDDRPVFVDGQTRRIVKVER